MNSSEDVRVRWWMQDTTESGHWEVSGVMPLDRAEKFTKSGSYTDAKVVKDEDGFPPYHTNWRDGEALAKEST